MRKTLGRNRLKIDSVWGSKWKQSKHFISKLMLWFLDVFFVKMWCLKEYCVSHSSDIGNLISSHSFCGCFLEISSLSESDILVLRLDLTDRSSHEAATNSVLKHFGKVRCASGVKILFLCLQTHIYAHISLLFYCMINSALSTSSFSFSVKLAKKYLHFYPFCYLLLVFSNKQITTGLSQGLNSH